MEKVAHLNSTAIDGDHLSEEELKLIARGLVLACKEERRAAEMAGVENDEEVRNDEDEDEDEEDPGCVKNFIKPKSATGRHIFRFPNLLLVAVFFVFAEQLVNDYGIVPGFFSCVEVSLGGTHPQI